jgi:hypothetical protein
MLPLILDAERCGRCVTCVARCTCVWIYVCSQTVRFGHSMSCRHFQAGPRAVRCRYPPPGPVVRLIFAGKQLKMAVPWQTASPEGVHSPPCLRLQVVACRSVKTPLRIHHLEVESSDTITTKAKIQDKEGMLQALMSLPCVGS